MLSGHNGMLCKPFSPEDLAKAIDRLWKNPAEVARLGDNNLVALAPRTALKPKCAPIWRRCCVTGHPFVPQRPFTQLILDRIG